MRSSIFKTVILAFCLFALSCSGYQSEQIDLAEVRTAIEETNSKFMEAFKKQDAAAVAAFYTEDAMLMPPNFDAVRGREVLKEFYEGGFAMGLTDLHLGMESVAGESKLVYETGIYSVNIAPEGHVIMKDTGKYLVIWKQGDAGHWQRHVDIWNSSFANAGGKK